MSTAFKEAKKEFSLQQISSWYMKKIAGPFLVKEVGLLFEFDLYYIMIHEYRL